MKIGSLSTHPAADCLPLMDDEALRSLADDLDCNGLRRKPVLCEGMILDGRNRCKAVLIVNERRAKRGEAPIELAFDEYTGETDKASLARYVWSENGERRNMGLVMRAIVLRRLNSWSRERKERSANQPALPAVVSHEMAQAIDVVTADGCEELQRAFQSGDVPPDVAKRLAEELEPDQQREVLEKWFSPVKDAASSPQMEVTLSRAVELSPADLAALRALVAYGEKESGIVRAGAAVVKRVVPGV